MDIELKYRNTEELDYEELCSWWKWHRFKAPIRQILPDNMSDGVMISLGSENICAGFLYRTSSSSLFHCEWIVSTYKVKNKEIRKKAVLLLIEALKYMAIEMGAKVIYTSLVNENLIQSYLDSGYVKGSKGATEMVFTIS